MTRSFTGQDGLDQAEAITKALFSGDVSTLSKEAIADVFQSAASIRLVEVASAKGRGRSWSTFWSLPRW